MGSCAGKRVLEHACTCVPGSETNVDFLLTGETPIPLNDGDMKRLAAHVEGLL